jgi:hypothetical protein
MNSISNLGKQLEKTVVSRHSSPPLSSSPFSPPFSAPFSAPPRNTYCITLGEGKTAVKYYLGKSSSTSIGRSKKTEKKQDRKWNSETEYIEYKYREYDINVDDESEDVKKWWNSVSIRPEHMHNYKCVKCTEDTRRFCTFEDNKRVKSFLEKFELKSTIGSISCCTSCLWFDYFHQIRLDNCVDSDEM